MFLGVSLREIGIRPDSGRIAEESHVRRFASSFPQNRRDLLEKLRANIACAMDHSANVHAVALRGVEHDMRLKAEAAKAFPQLVRPLAYAGKVREQAEGAD